MLKSVETSLGDKVTIFWNQLTELSPTTNQIRGNEKGTCMLAEGAVSEDRSVNKKEAEKILKYKNLTIEIQRMWNIKTKMIPVIIGATGTISESFRKHVETMKSRNYRKQLYWALHTYFGKY